MSDIQTLMTRSWGELEKLKPVPLPDGHWTLKGDRIFFYAAKTGDDGKQKSARIQFSYRAVAPQGDVDTRALDMLPEGYDFGITTVQSDSFFLADIRDLNRVMAHLAKHDGFEVSRDEPLLVEGEEGLVVNPAIRRAFAGATVSAVLSLDDYVRQGETEPSANVARKFTTPGELANASSSISVTSPVHSYRYVKPSA